MKYNNENLEIRKKHFELLNKLAEYKKLDCDDVKELIRLIVQENPYTYKDYPKLIFKDKNEVKKGMYGSYNSFNNTLTFVLNNNFTTMNLVEALNTIGHEMKHYNQTKTMTQYKDLSSLEQNDKNKEFAK